MFNYVSMVMNPFAMIRQNWSGPFVCGHFVLCVHTSHHYGHNQLYLHSYHNNNAEVDVIRNWNHTTELLRYLHFSHFQRGRSHHFLYKLYFPFCKLHHMPSMHCESGKSGQFIYGLYLLLCEQHLPIIKLEALACFYAVKQLFNSIDICSCSKRFTKHTTRVVHERT